MPDIAQLGFSVDTRGIDQGITKLDKFGKQEDMIGTKAVKSGGLIKKSMASAKGAIDRANTSGKGLTTTFGGLSGLVGGLSFVALGKGAITMAANFDGAMNTVQSKLLISNEEMVRLRDRAKELGSTTQFSATQAGDAMGFLAQAGLDASKIYDAMPSTLNLAAAAGMDLASAADIATNVMGGFGLEVNDLPMIMDTLAITSARANTSVEEMAGAFKQSGPVAVGFKTDLKDTASIIGVLANNGYKAEQAGTIVKNMFTKLANPLAQGRKALEEYEITQDDLFRSTADGSMEFVGMGNLLDLLGAKGVSTKDTLRIFGQLAGPGMASLISSGKVSIQDLRDEMERVGTTTDMANIQMQGLPGALKLLSSAWEGLNLAIMDDSGGSSGMVTVINKITDALGWLTVDGIKYFDAFVAGIANGISFFKPAFDSVVLLITQFKNAFMDIPQSPFERMQFGEIDKGSKAVQLFAEGLKTVLSFLKPVLPYLSQLVVGMVGLKVAVGVAGTVAATFKGIAAAAGLMNPITLIIASIAGSALLIYKNWEGITKWWSGLWSNMKTAGSGFINWWNSTTFKEKVLDVGTKFVETARTVVSGFFNWWDGSTLKQHTPMIVVNGLESVRNTAKQFFSWWDNTPMNEKIAHVKASFNNVRTQLQNFVQDYWSKPLDEKIATLKTAGIDLAEKATNGFFKLWDTTLKQHAPEIIVNGVESARKSIGDFFTLWRTSTLAEIVAKVETSALTAAGNATTALKSLWDNSTLKEKTPKIVVGLIESAFKVVSNIQTTWASWTPISKALAVGTKSIELAAKVVGDLYDFWKLPLGEKVAKVTYGTLQLAVDAVKGIRNLWDNFSFDPKSIDIEFPDTTWLRTKIRESVTVIKDGIKKGFAEFLVDNPVVKELFDGMITSIKDETSRLVDAAKLLAADFISGLTEGFTNKFGEFKNFVGGKFAEIPLLGKFLGGDITDEIVKGLEGGSPEVQSALDSLVLHNGTFINREKTLREVLEMGKNIPEGLIQGLRDGTVSVAQAMEKLSEAGVIIPTKKKLGIESPSKLLRQFGRWLAQGLGLGVIDEIPTVVSSSEMLGREAVNAVSKELTDGQKDIADAFGGMFTGATDLGDVIDNLKNSAKTIVQNLANTFAKEKITAFFQVEGNTGGGGFISKLGSVFSNNGEGGGFLSKLGGIFSGGGEGGGLLSKLGGLLGGGGGTASTSAGGLSGLASTLGPVAVAAGIGGIGGGLVGKLTGGNEERAGQLGAAGAAIGTLVGGPLGAALGGAAGAVVGSAFGTKFKEVERGFQVGVTGGQVSGQSFSTEEKKKSFWRGTESRTSYSELDAGIEAQISGYFESLNNAVITSASALGVSGADSILNSFEVATQQFSGENAEAELTQWLEDSTRSAYSVAFTNLGPELQTYISDSVDMVNAPMSEITALFDHLAMAANVFTPALQNAGIQLSDSFGGAVTDTSKLIEAMGGGEAGTQQLIIMLNLLTDAEKEADTALMNITDNVLSLTNRVGTVAPIWDALYESMDRNSTNLLAYTRSITQAEIIDQTAIDQINAFAFGIDETTGKVNVSLAAMLAYRDHLDTSTEAGANAAQSLDSLTQSLGFNLDSVVASKDALIEEIQAADASTDAGRARIAQLTSELDSVIALEAEHQRLSTGLNVVSETAKLLNLNFDTLNPAAVGASDALIQLFGGIEGFNNASQSYYNDFYSAEERKNIQLAQSAATVLDFTASLSAEDQARIKTREGFREYVEGLDLTTEAGINAYHAALDVSSSLAAVTEGGATLETTLATLPDGMVNTFTAMETTITQSSQRVSDDTVAAVNMLRDTWFNGHEAIQLLTEDGNAQQADEMRSSMQERLADIVASNSEHIRLQTNASGEITGIIDTMSGALVASVDAGTGQVTNLFDGSMNVMVTSAQTADMNIATGSNNIVNSTSVAGGALTGLGSSINSLVNLVSTNAQRAAAASQAAQEAANSGTASLATINRLAGEATDAARDNHQSQQALIHSLIAQGVPASEAIARVNGSHATGFDYVPFDGYMAQLHEGEKILNKRDASKHRSGLDRDMVSGSNDKSLVAELKLIKNELTKIRDDNKKSTESNMKGLEYVAKSGDKQAEATYALDKTVDRSRRSDRINKVNS